MKSILLFILSVVAVFAQNAALMPVAKQGFWYDNASGKPLAGGFIYTCVAGTSCAFDTPGDPPSANGQLTYTDSTAAVANPDPVILDAAGQAAIWLTNRPYKIVVVNIDGVVQYSADNVQAAGPFGPNNKQNPLYIDLSIQTGAAVNSPSTCNDTAFTAAIAAALTGPGFVLVPAGTWYVCSTIVIPQGVMVAGPGHWSQEPEFGTVQNAVVKAGASFSVGTGYQGFVFTLGGLTNNNQYGARIENMSVDGSGIANGEYIAQAQEHAGMAFVDTLNFPLYGAYECGADAGGVCGTNLPNGAQSDGDYHDLQFAPSDQYGMTSATVPIYLNNLTGIREWRNITIAPFATDPANRPLYGVVAWGFKWTMRHVHIEAIQTAGLLVSPQSPVCTGACGGTIGAVVEDINTSNTASGASVIKIAGATNTSEHYGNINSDGAVTCLIRYDLSNGYNGCIGGTGGTPTTPVLQWWIDGAGVPQGHEYVEIFNGQMSTNAGIIERNSTGPVETWSGSGPTFGLNRVTASDNGDVTFDKSVGNTSWLWSGSFSPFAMYNGTPYSGLNLMGGITNGGTLAARTAICSNLYWRNLGTTWTAGGNGGTDYSCMVDGNYGFGLSLSNTGAGTGANISNTTLVGNLAWMVAKATGHTIFGTGSENPSDGTINDNKGQIQTPSIGNTSGSNNDLSGTLTFSSSDTSNTYSFAASGSTHPDCTMTGDFLNGYVYEVYGGSSGVWTLTAKSNTSNSGHATYICVLRP